MQTMHGDNNPECHGVRLIMTMVMMSDKTSNLNTCSRRPQLTLTRENKFICKVFLPARRQHHLNLILKTAAPKELRLSYKVFEEWRCYVIQPKLPLGRPFGIEVKHEA